MKPKHRNMAEVATRALRTADLDTQIEQRVDEQKKIRFKEDLPMTPEEQFEKTEPPR